MRASVSQAFAVATRKFSLLPSQTLDLGDLILGPSQVEPGTLGVHFLEREGHAVVGWVVPNGPGARAGLLGGDVVLALDGTSVQSAAEAQARSLGPPGSQVIVNYRRDGLGQTVSATRQPAPPAPQMPIRQRQVNRAGGELEL